MKSRFNRQTKFVHGLMASVAFCAVVLAFSPPGLAQDKKARASKPAAIKTVVELDEATKERYRVFKERMTGIRLTGKFTMNTQKNGPPITEQYDIISVKKKAEGDFWEITCRIKYMKNDITLPLPIEVKWAGNTPVLTVDNLYVPGLGTFDARVLLRKNKYAGTWAHGDVGGHLFGSLTKIPPGELKSADKEPRKKDD